jgi:crotonobetainyl-CoA:carnitine CoA-transferase CaiB-like acyl-CoA transferase
MHPCVLVDISSKKGAGMASNALEGIRVLDLSRQFPGPYCTMILSDFGAEVLRIEDRRFQMDLFQWDAMRNKRHMTLNLKTDKGKEIFFKLLKDADVMVEGFRPGAAKRLGIDYESVSKLKPDIIYCSVTGYGQTGPYSGMAGHDLNYISFAGILDLIGESDRPPVIPPVQIGDIGGGLNAAIGILLALFHRQRTGEGQHVDISMMDAAIGFMNIPFTDMRDLGQPMQRGQMALTGQFPFYNVYETRDGRYITLAAVEPRFWERICQVMGCEQYSKNHICSGARREEIFRYLRERFKTKTQQEWYEVFKNEDVCFAKVLKLSEVHDDPQASHRQIITTIQTRAQKDKPTIGPVVKLSRTKGRIKSEPAEFGEHTEEVLKELGYSDAEIKNFREQGVV